MVQCVGDGWVSETVEPSVGAMAGLPGMSTSGPITSFSDCTSLRVMRSSSGSVRSLGSQHTPPLAPPKGTSTTAVFHVFRLDRLQRTPGVRLPLQALSAP